MALRRQQYRFDKVGIRALNWLLASGRNEQFDFLLNTRFVTVLLFSVVAEGREDFIWDWVRSDATPVFARNDRNADCNSRGMILINIMEHQIHWSSDHLRVEPALHSYFDAKGLHSGLDPKHGHLVKMAPAGRFLIRLFRNAAGRCVLPESYDRFMSTLAWLGHPEAIAWQKAVLKMFHPVTPDHQHVFRLFRWWARSGPGISEFAKEETHPREWGEAWVLYWTIARVAQALEKQGERHEARWLLDQGSDWRPAIFSQAARPTDLPRLDLSFRKHQHGNAQRPASRFRDVASAFRADREQS